MNAQPHRTRWIFSSAVLFLGVLALIAICIVLSESNSGLEQRLVDSASQLRQSKDQVKKHEDLIRTLTASLKSSQELSSELQQALDRSYVELEEAKDEFRRQQAVAEMENRDLQLEISKLQLQITSLGKEIVGLEKRNQEQKIKIADLEKRIDEQRTLIAALEKRIDEQAREIVALEKRIGEQRTEIVALKKTAADQVKEIVVLKQRVLDQLKEIADLKERIVGYQVEIAALNQQVANQQTQIASLDELLKKRRREPFINSVGIWMVPINDGQFQMGSLPNTPGAKPDEVLHDVQLTRPFYMSAHEVTQEQYSRVIKARPPWEGEAFVNNGPRYPASYVTYDDAVKFCDTLTAMEGIPGATYRLPTEAEWEYACRAGRNAPPGAVNAWLGPGDRPPQRVGQKRPNPWGLYDMHGNVEEWCQDWYGPYNLAAVVDPTGPDEGLKRVLRGGSINLPAIVARSASRESGDKDDIRSSRGFRVIRTYTAPQGG